MTHPYEQGLERNEANYTALTPVSYLAKAATVYPDQVAVIHGSLRRPWKDVYSRCRRLASALAGRGIRRGDTVAAMLPNVPAMVELHFGPAMIGAVVNTLNTRLDPEAIAFMLDHGEAKVLFTDREFSGTVEKALALCQAKPLVIDVDDAMHEGGKFLGEKEYESFLQEGNPAFEWTFPPDEWDAIALNYTSGTTGNPKGVVYHYRGAYLNAINNIIDWSMPKHPTYLWTLPMFHCNGWCFPWSITLVGGTHVCLRWVRAKAIYDAIVDHGVTHISGAPIVMSTLLNATDAEKREIPQVVAFNHAAAPPPEAVLSAMTDAGFMLTHLYGLTETYGPATINEWDAAWNDLPKNERNAKKIRQGVRYVALEGLTVMDPETMTRVPADGETLGEVMFRGNIVMKGYLKNPKATEEAFAGGWFHSGDLGVLHPDGYIQLKDRSKDIIISGGENISSIEVEDVLYKHPAVAFCAVVAKPDEKWGETPCAFVELRSGANASAEELLEWCRAGLARYKVPRHLVFAEVPKTSTGKIQKFKLREMAKEA